AALVLLGQRRQRGQLLDERGAAGHRGGDEGDKRRSLPPGKPRHDGDDHEEGHKASEHRRTFRHSAGSAAGILEAARAATGTSISRPTSRGMRRNRNTEAAPSAPTIRKTGGKSPIVRVSVPWKRCDA